MSQDLAEATVLNITFCISYTPCLKSLCVCYATQSPLQNILKRHIIDQGCDSFAGNLAGSHIRHTLTQVCMHTYNTEELKRNN